MSMDWANERYVRLYLRDTVTWRKWSWDARAAWPLFLRKLDRSGVLDTGRDDKAEALSLIIDAPLPVCAKALGEWVAAGAVVVTETALVVPNFIAAQETPQSDRMRQQESRERKKTASLRNSEDACHAVSRTVTDRHESSQVVTPDQTRPDQTRPAQPSPDQAPAKSKKPKKAPAPVQASLEVVPEPPPLEPKAPSLLARLHARFEKSRDSKLYAEAVAGGLELELDAHPDEEPDWGRSAAVLAQWKRLWPDISEAELEDRVRCMASEWLESPFWASLKDRDGKPKTPFPWGAFITPKQWGPIAKELFGADVERLGVAA